MLSGFLEPLTSLSPSFTPPRASGSSQSVPPDEGKSSPRATAMRVGPAAAAATTSPIPAKAARTEATGDRRTRFGEEANLSPAQWVATIHAPPAAV